MTAVSIKGLSVQYGGLPGRLAIDALDQVAVDFRATGRKYQLDQIRT